MNRLVAVDESLRSSAGWRRKTARSDRRAFDISGGRERTEMAKKNPRSSQPVLVQREDIYGFIYRSWVKNRGVPRDRFDGRPVIGICNTWSELTPCNTHFRTLAEHVRRRAGSGASRWNSRRLSLGETLMRPPRCSPHPPAWTSRNRFRANLSTASSC